MKMVEGAQLRGRQPLTFRPQNGERALQPLGQAGGAIVVAHSIEDIGHGKAPDLLFIRPLPVSGYQR
jgi:hypothetical protein